MTPDLLRAVFGSTRWVRYGGASAVALALDTLVFLMLLELGLPAFTASAAGYCLGIAAHWLISSRLVFAGGLRERGAARRGQQAEFLASALVGLIVTQAIMLLAGHWAVDPRLGKLVAVVVSFQLTYMLRRRFVFA